MLNSRQVDNSIVASRSAYLEELQEITWKELVARSESLYDQQQVIAERLGRAEEDTVILYDQLKLTFQELAQLHCILKNAGIMPSR